MDKHNNGLPNHEMTIFSCRMKRGPTCISVNMVVEFHGEAGEIQYFYRLMNIFKGLFDILSHYLIEVLRSQKLTYIVANLFLDYDEMEW